MTALRQLREHARIELVRAAAAGSAIAIGETIRIASFGDTPGVTPHGIVLALAWVSTTVIAAMIGAGLTLAEGLLLRHPGGVAVLASDRVRRGLLAAAVLGVLGFTLAVAWRWPEASQAPPRTLAIVVIAALACRAARAERVRGSTAAALVIAALAGIGSFSIAWSPVARRGVVAQGVMSRITASAIWWAADRDGDGYAPAWIGGADCDDGDARRSPRRLEIAGNGIDENCTGVDAPLSVLAARATVAPTGRAPRANVLVISIDTLRADHLGAWGYGRATSPAIDALARSGARFASAVTASPTTRFAVPALFTGRFASTLDPEAPPASLAQVLAATGYATHAVLCCQRLVATRELRGFASVDTTPERERAARAGQSNADTVTSAAIGWLTARATAAAAPPFLLWTHYYDPHYPYAAPGGSPFGASAMDRYDGEIRFVDGEVGRLLGAIEALHLASSTIVVLVADHGEEMEEHGLRFHARSLYQQVIQIPLIIRVPGAAPVVVEPTVSLVDVMPTILDLVGVPGPALMNGKSLAGAIAGGAVPDRPGILVELIPDSWFKRDGLAAISPRFKVIWARDADAWRLYARADREDRTELSAREPAALAAMQALLRELADAELSGPETQTGGPIPGTAGGVGPGPR